MLNKITVHGYLGRDPESKEYRLFKNETTTRTVFTLGVPRSLGVVTDWFYCVAFGKTADTADKYLHKGSEVIIDGHMESYRPENGDKPSWNIRVRSFDFCGKKDSGKQTDERAPEGFTEFDGDDEELADLLNL